MLKRKGFTQVVIIISIAFLLRIVLFAVILEKNSDGFGQYDSKSYYIPLAINMIDNGVFSTSYDPPHFPDDHHTPFYPLFLGIFYLLGLDTNSIIITQILLSCATVFIVILLSDKLFKVRYPGLVAGSLLAINIPSIIFSNILLNETVFTFLITLASYFLVLFIDRPNSYSKMIWSAILFGSAILCRPIAFLIPLFLIPVFFLIQNRQLANKLRYAFIFVIVCILVVSPWIIRNQITFNTPFLATVGNTNLLYFRAAGIISEKKQIPMVASQKQLWEEVADEYGDQPYDAVKFSRLERDKAIKIIGNDPVLYTKNHLTSVCYLLFKPLRAPIDFQLGLRDEYSTLTPWGTQSDSNVITRLFQTTSNFTIVLVAIQFLMLLLIWVGFVMGIIELIMNKNFLSILLILLVIIYFCLISGGPEANARFRIPIIPFISIVASVGIVNNKWSKKLIRQEEIT